jgi:hypothetical protein
MQPVMAGLVQLVPAAMHAPELFVARAVELMARGTSSLVARKTWMPGTRPHKAGHDDGRTLLLRNAIGTPEVRHVVLALPSSN